MLLLQEKPDGSAKNIVFGVAFVITIIMAIYIYYKMRGCKKALLEEQEARKHIRRLRKDSEVVSAQGANAGAEASGGGLFQQGTYLQEEAQPLQATTSSPPIPGGNRFDEPTAYHGRTTTAYQAETTPYPSDAGAYMPAEPSHPGLRSPRADHNQSGYRRAQPQDQYHMQDQPLSRPPTNSGQLNPVEGKTWV